MPEHRSVARRDGIVAAATGVGLATAFGVGLLLQAVVRWSVRQWGERDAIVFLMAAGIALLSAVVVYVSRTHLARRLKQALSPRWMKPDLLRIHGEPAAPAEIVVVGISPGPGVESVFIALRHHRAVLRKVYALHTPGEPLLASLERLREEARALELPAGLVESVELPPSAFHDPSAIYTALNAIIDAAGPEADLVLDYTGGTKAFTAAMALAASGGGRRLEYVIPAERDARGRAVPGTDGQVVEVELQFDPGAP